MNSSLINKSTVEELMHITLGKFGVVLLLLKPVCWVECLNAVDACVSNYVSVSLIPFIIQHCATRNVAVKRFNGCLYCILVMQFSCTLLSIHR